MTKIFVGKEKNCWSKKLLINKIFDHKNVGETKFWSKNVCLKKMLVGEKFWSEKILLEKKLGLKKNFGSEKKLRLKNIWV